MGEEKLETASKGATPTVLQFREERNGVLERKWGDKDILVLF